MQIDQNKKKALKDMWNPIDFHQKRQNYTFLFFFALSESVDKIWPLLDLNIKRVDVISGALII